MVEYIIQNWQESFDKTYYLYQLIKSSGFIPDVIIGVARGGWVPGRLLADFFQIRETINIKVESYHLIGEAPEEAIITQDVTGGIMGKKVLIVDDIADTGESLKVVIKSVQDKKPSKYKTATLHYKPQSEIIPDYYIMQTEAWVIYPWEFYESIRDLNEIFKSEGLDPNDSKLKLKKIGLPAQMVDSYFFTNS